MILVTGGAGFIGGHVVETLSAAGREVVALYDLTGGSASRVPSGVPLVGADVSDPGVVETIAGPRFLPPR